MTAGPVNRALLDSFFQQPGDIYDDSKTEGSFDVVADQIDENWTYLASLVSNQTLLSLNIYVATLYGVVGDGVTNDTAALQTLINTAIAAGRKAIYFPHTTTGGQYYVTALTNADQVVFYGDNASFVGGYTGVINQVGETGTDVSGYVYLSDYGAVGNGVADDYTAFVNAIAACGVGGVLIIPEPSVTYRSSQKIVISAPIRIIGTHFKVSTSENPTITFDASVLTGFESTSTDVTIERLAIKLNSTSGSVVAGIHLNSPNPSGNANTQLRDLFIYMNHTLGAGVKGRNVITSEFHNVRTFQGAYGFYFDTAGTSLKFDSCWAMSCTVTGYYVASHEYCSFINCACDSPNNPNYAYHLNVCNGISFVSCGSESMGKSMFRFQGGNGISVDACRAVGANISTLGVASFAEITDNARNITFTSCMESGQAGTAPNVTVVAGSFFPICINCFFSSIKMNSTTYTDTLANRSVIKMSGLVISASPFSGDATMFLNHDIGIADKRLGVLKTDGSVWYGYIDKDGTILVGSFAALPTASVTYRGIMARVLGNGTTTADILYMCMMSATGTYSWKQIISG